MQNKVHFYPIKTGHFGKIENIDDKAYCRAIFRCHIKAKKGKIDNRLFKINEDGYYTDLDIKRAEKLNYDIKLIKDEDPNILYWTKNESINGYHIFKNFVLYFFKLKHKGLVFAKNILKSLHGQLIRTNITTALFKNLDNIKVNGIVKSVIPSPNGVIIKYVKGDNYFAQPKFARIIPFMYSISRNTMSTKIEQVIDKIMYSHTDSFYSTVPLHNDKNNVAHKCVKYPIKIGNDLGNIKYLGCEKWQIISGRRLKIVS